MDRLVAFSFHPLPAVLRADDPRPLRASAGALLILAGVHDTLVYWML
jgi:hypothetical protein